MAERPSPEEISRWQKWFAVACNNRAWELIEKTARTPADVHEMLHAAHASAWHWARVGTDLNEARANMLLGMAHALASDGPLGLRYASSAFNYFNEHEAPDWEQAFAHATLAAAAKAAGNADLHREHYAEAARLGEAIAAPEDRSVFQRSFAQVPRP
ncbi:MAG TPA: hypothetical protein VM032_00465 [Vicinamibacterales bacterium]|nr:hypothetical protein [Vicinamibacterales bacterium]